MLCRVPVWHTVIPSGVQISQIIFWINIEIAQSGTWPNLQEFFEDFLHFHNFFVVPFFLFEPGYLQPIFDPSDINCYKLVID